MMGENSAMRQNRSLRQILSMVFSVLMVGILLIFSIATVGITSRRLRENARDNMSMVLGQYESSIDNYLSGVEDAFSAVESDSEFQAYSARMMNGTHSARDYVRLMRTMQTLINLNPTTCYSVAVYYSGISGLQQSYQKDLMKINFDPEIWEDRFPDTSYRWILADSCRDLIPDRNVGAILLHRYKRGDSHYYFLIAIRQSFLEEIMSADSLPASTAIALLSEDAVLGFGEETALDTLRERSAELTAESHRGVLATNLGDYYTARGSLNTGWKIAYAMPKREIESARYIVREFIGLTVIVVGLAVFLIAAVARRLSRPLTGLTVRVGAEDVLEKPFTGGSYRELSELSNGLEGMRVRINNLLREVELEQEEVHRIEIALLQQQVNPHFLYNTLNAILQLCEMGENEAAARMVTALSEFYRISLSGGDELITVEEELKHVENYLLIQHLRYGNLFDYTIDCEEEILDIRLPKMSLQPLVENAIYHGIRKKHGKGNICILGGSYDGRECYLEVHDDGAGITQEQLARMRDALKRHEREDMFGIYSVDTRIRYTFGEGSGIELYSDEEDTCARIRFMRKTEEEGEE